jgi:hypothetical protein
LIRTYLYILLRRAVGFWIGVRLLYAIVLASIPSYLPGSPLIEGSARMAPGGALIVVAAVTTLVLFDARAVGEDVLAANFGVSRFRAALPVIALIVLLETAVLVFFKLRAP